MLAKLSERQTEQYAEIRTSYNSVNKVLWQGYPAVCIFSP